MTTLPTVMRATLLAVAVAAAGGCGYQFAAGGRHFEAGTRTIGIRTLTNKLRQYGYAPRARTFGKAV